MSLKRFFYQKFNITIAWWKDSRGSFHYGFWQHGKFTGLRYQVPASKAELTTNPAFLCPGHDLEFVIKGEPYGKDGPFVWFKSVD